MTILLTKTIIPINMVDIPKSIEVVEAEIIPKLFSVYVEILAQGEDKKQVAEVMSRELGDKFGQENISIYNVDPLVDTPYWSLEDEMDFREDEVASNEGV